MSDFKAGVQYNDLVGTTAADIADRSGLIEQLRAEGFAKADEVLIGMRIASGSVSRGPVEDVSVVAYLVNKENAANAPAKVRAVEVRTTPGQALAFFKRFDLVMMRRGMDFSATEVDGPYYN